MTRRASLIAVAALALVALTAAACSSDDDDDDTGPSDPTRANTPTTVPDDDGVVVNAHGVTVDTSDIIVGAVLNSWPSVEIDSLTVNPDGIIFGCAGRDCIRALDAPGAVSIESDRLGTAIFAPAGEVQYNPEFPVAVVNLDGQVRGYPLHILTRHEIVNDVLNGTPIAVTYCPLCNTVLTFERDHQGQVLDFGVSGLLRNSDLIMWDRQTESLWQQATGEGIGGPLSNTDLAPITTFTISYRDFVQRFPDAEILTENTGLASTYGFNPYSAYDRPGTRPFLYGGEFDERLDALERVVALQFEGEEIAVPFSTLAETGTANLTVGGQPVTVLWAPGTKSVLDTTQIDEAKDIGAAIAYSADLDGQLLTFEANGDATFTDAETGSTWDITGLALAGPMEGQSLQPVLHTNEFWFAWSAFHPETEIWQA